MLWGPAPKATVSPAGPTEPAADGIAIEDFVGRVRPEKKRRGRASIEEVLQGRERRPSLCNPGGTR